MALINWVLNTSYKEQMYSNGNQIVLDSFDFETTEKETSIRKDSDYVILHNTKPQLRQTTNENKAWKNDAFHTFKFTQIGKVIEVSKPEMIPYSPQEIKTNENRKAKDLPLLKQRRKFTLKLVGKPITINNGFDDLTYSLSSIHNYAKPISHFQQQITSIGEKDFETIEKGWVYLHRTIFGKIANILPFENRFEFSLMISREYKTVRFRGLPYQELLKKLIEYIETRIHGRGHLITATDILLNNISEAIHEDLTPIGFSSYEQSIGNTKPGDEIKTQANLFEELFASYKELDIKSILEKRDPYFERFNKLFEKREWPLNLN